MRLLSRTIARLDVEMDTAMAFVRALECLAIESAEPGIANAARELGRRYQDMSQKLKFLVITTKAEEATSCELST